MVTALALGGSTNAIIHLLALARQASVKLALANFDAVSRGVSAGQHPPVRRLPDGGFLLCRRPSGRC
ncbi:MAG: dihydroxy-acid dehydratase [Dongiaceae bacterium]